MLYYSWSILSTSIINTTTYTTQQLLIIIHVWLMFETSHWPSLLGGYHGVLASQSSH